MNERSSSVNSSVDCPSHRRESTGVVGFLHASTSVGNGRAWPLVSLRVMLPENWLALNDRINEA